MTDYARLHGSEDMDLGDKNRVRAIVRDLGYETLFNKFAVEHRDGSFNFNFEITRAEKDDIVEFHRPDVVVTGRPEWAVIEIDGAVHKGGRKDQRRNEFYKRHGIQLIIINKADLAETGTSWEEYIAWKLDGTRGDGTRGDGT